jgi:predicted metal-binding protein
MFVLIPVEDTPSIIVCNTCRFSSEEREDAHGKRGGALLAEHLRKYGADVASNEMPCLFACSRHCSVHLRAPGKIGYVLGDFRPDDNSANAILAFFRLYRDSEHGVVPYSQWPEGVKGHFIVRTPPPGFTVG